MVVEGSAGGGLESLLDSELGGESDVSQALKEMFRDGIEDDTNRRIIDQKSDLTDAQIRTFAVADFLVYKGLFANLDVLTHSVKRLSVSRNRKGRSEMVDVARGMGEKSARKGFVRRFFGGKE